MKTITTVDEYLSQFEGETYERLCQIRELIRTEAPDAVEGYSYDLAGYKLHGKPLVYFGGFTKHIGFYATPNGHEAFAADFAPYKQGKGSVQFPHTEPLPLELVRRVVRYRVAQLSDA